MKYRKVSLLSLLTILLIGLTFLFSSFTQKRITTQKKAQVGISDLILFHDVFSSIAAWRLTLPQGTSITLDATRGHSNLGSLRLSSPSGAEGMFAEHQIATSSGVISRIFFYDDMGPVKAAIFQVDNFEGDNDDLLSFVGVNTTIDRDHYVVRTKRGPLENRNRCTFSSAMPRSLGWHIFEIITTEDGSIIKIDSEFVNTSPESPPPGVPLDCLTAKLTSVSKIMIFSTWGIGGASWWDDLSVVKADLRSPDEQLWDSFKDYYEIYNSTNFTRALDNMREGELRTLSNTALSFYIYGKKFQDPVAKSRGLALFGDILNHYNRITVWDAFEPGQTGNIDRTWTRGMNMLSYTYAALSMWDDLSISARSKVETEVAYQANMYFMYVPPDVAFSDTWRNQWPRSNSDYDPGDTKAEENGWNAGFLATAANFFSYLPNSAEWEKRARCFAFHTITTGEIYSDSSCLVYKEYKNKPGIPPECVREDYCYKVVPDRKSQTVTVVGGKWYIFNHGSTSPLYGTSAIKHPAQGGLAYLSAGKAVPSEFRHNMETLYNNFIKPNIEMKPLFSRTTYYYPHYYQYPLGIPGHDWGGISNAFYSAAPLVLSYLERLGSSTGISWQDLLSRRSLYYYKILSKYTDPVDIINSAEIDLDAGCVTTSCVWFQNSIQAGEVYFPSLIFRGQYSLSVPHPTATPTRIPISTPTRVPPTSTPRPTATMTPRPTATLTPKPTATMTPKPTATMTPKPTSTPTRVPPTLTPRPTPTSTPKPTVTMTPRPTNTPIPTAIPCARKAEGDADCNGKIDIIDFEIWRREFLRIDTTTKADFDSSGGVTILDFEIWRRGILG